MKSINLDHRIPIYKNHDPRKFRPIVLSCILIHPKIKASFGLLGTTFGGNHLACTAALAVIETIQQEKLLDNVEEISTYFIHKVSQISEIKKVKGRGLMLGLEFDFPIAELRKELIYNHHIFTGSSKNPNLLRILPSLTVKKEHVDVFINALTKALELQKV